jgi:hypothetical protein
MRTAKLYIEGGTESAYELRALLELEGYTVALSYEEADGVLGADGFAYDGEKPYIFASYSHRNSESVLEVIGKLRKAGYRVWYDEGIDPGSEWDDFIAEKIEKCGYFIAFLSEEYLESKNCRDELNYARDLDKDRLLVYLTGVKLTGGLAMRLNRLQAIHKYKYSSTAAFFEKLTSTPALDSFKN